METYNPNQYPSYNPPECPEIEVFYVIIDPGQKQIGNQPGVDPEIEIQFFHINGKEISSRLHENLLENHGDKWTNDIIELIKFAKAVA